MINPITDAKFIWTKNPNVNFITDKSIVNGENPIVLL